jgi:hypothetical protein
MTNLSGRAPAKGNIMTEIRDFFLAVYLRAMGEEMTDLHVQPEEIFRFAHSPTLQERIEAYRADTALVNPKIFAREIMKLRQQLQTYHQEAG